MKKILKGLLFAFVAVLGLTLASCEDQPEVPAHEHTLKSEEWKRDSATHWQECTTCDEYANMSVHTYGEWTFGTTECNKKRECTVCHYVQTQKVDHTWGDWTLQADGSMGKECTVCGQKESVVQYYVRGGMNNWGNDGFAPEYTLEIDYEKMEASIVVTLTAGVEFKVANSDWSKEFNTGTIVTEGEWFEGDGNIKVKETAEYKIVVTGLGGDAHTCTITQLCVHEFAWTVQAGKTCDYDGVCTKCQATSTKVEHAYGEYVTAEGKCEATATCAGCGDTHTKEIDHTFVNGVCSHCGSYDIIQFYLRGDMNGWGTSLPLVYDAATDTASVVLFIAASQGFKVADSNWANQFGSKNGSIVANDGGSGNINVAEDGNYKVVVSGMSTGEKTLTITKVEATAYYVKGGMNGWSANDDYKLVYDAATNSATITLQIEAGVEFKISDANWVVDFGYAADGVTLVQKGYNMTVATTGTYVITVTGVDTAEIACTIALAE